MKNILKKIQFDKPLIIIATVAVFFLINLLLSGMAYRADFSQGRAYTLSPATQKIIRKLDDVVTIKFYVSSDLPSTLTPAKTSVQDFLTQYKTAGGNHIIIKTVDPKKDTNAAKEAQELQIPQLQFSQLQNDKYQVSAAYFALGIFYGSNKEVIPQATDLANLEYNITSAVYKLTNKELPQIAVAGIDQGTPGQNDPFSPFKTTISKQFQPAYLDLAANDIKDLKAYKTLVVIDANQAKFPDGAADKVKQYLAEKGNVIMMADGVWVNDNLSTATADHNLFPLLQSQGITLQRNLVLSASAEYVNFGNASYQYLSAYPFWLKTNSFNTKTDYFSNISQLTFPWTSSVALDKKANGTVLVYSPNVSWQQNNTYELNPQNIPEPGDKDITRFPLIVSAKTASGGTLILIPSSRFVDARYLSQNSGNIEFVFNALNNLASGGALTGIRSRTLSFHQLPSLPDNQTEAVKYLTIGILPLMFAIYGAIRLIRRK